MLTDDENSSTCSKVQYRIKSDPTAPRFRVQDSRFAPDGDPALVVTRRPSCDARVGQKMDSGAVRIAPADRRRSAVRMRTCWTATTPGFMISAVASRTRSRRNRCRQRSSTRYRRVSDRQRQINEGQAYANDVVRARCNGIAADPGGRGLPDQDGRRAAQGDATRFRQVLSEYVKAPASPASGCTCTDAADLRQHHQGPGRHQVVQPAAVPAARKAAAAGRGGCATGPQRAGGSGTVRRRQGTAARTRAGARLRATAIGNRVK